MEDLHRLGDVLQLLPAAVGEIQIELVADQAVDLAGDADAARLRQALEPGRHVDAVAVDIVRLDDDVAEVDPHAEQHAAFLRLIGVQLGHRRLDRHRALDRVDHAGELDQRAVAGLFHDSAVPLGDPRIDDLSQQLHQARMGRGLVHSHEAAVANNVRSQDRGEAAIHAQSSTQIRDGTLLLLCS